MMDNKLGTFNIISELAAKEFGHSLYQASFITDSMAEVEAEEIPTDEPEFVTVEYKGTTYYVWLEEVTV